MIQPTMNIELQFAFQIVIQFDLLVGLEGKSVNCKTISSQFTRIGEIMVIAFICIYSAGVKFT